MLPNFLILGAPRSGTTYLHHCLAEHPDVYMAGLSYSGDINFFNPNSNISAIRYYDRGLPWYESLFNGRHNETAVGEKTAHYFADPEVPERIHKHIPEAKLVIVIRNPIERAYSNYWYSRGKLPSHLSFIEACHSPAGHGLRLLESGLYHQHLQKLLQFFPRNQIYIIIYDFLQRNPGTELAKLYHFLGVDAKFVPTNVNCRINGAIGPGNFMYRIRVFGHRIKTHHQGLFRMVKKLPTAWCEQYLGRRMSTISSNIGYPPLALEDKCLLASYFAEDTKEIGRRLCVDLEALWHNT